MVIKLSASLYALSGLVFGSDSWTVDEMQSPTPEVEPLPELVLAPLLGDPKFLALVLGLLSIVVACELIAVVTV